MDKKTLFKISYGMYVVSSKEGDRLNGQIANVVFQVTAEPPQISVAINKDNLTHQFISASKVFSVSILEEEAPMTFIGHFGFRSGRQIEKFREIEYHAGVTGVPIGLPHCLGYLECEVKDSIDAGTHTVFIAAVKEAEISKEGVPMTYAYYYKTKKGRSPKNAPTYNIGED